MKFERWINHPGKKRRGIKNPEKNHEKTKENRRIPRELGVQNADKLIKNRQEKLINQLNIKLNENNNMFEQPFGHTN